MRKTLIGTLVLSLSAGVALAAVSPSSGVKSSGAVSPSSGVKSSGAVSPSSGVKSSGAVSPSSGVKSSGAIGQGFTKGFKAIQRALKSIER